MPQQNKNDPDHHDVFNIVASLAEEFGVQCHFYVRYTADFIEVIGKTHAAPYVITSPVVHVALQKLPYASKRSLPNSMYTIAFDLWLQHDGGGASAASRGPTYGWNGRVEIPRRRKRS